jgi:hypothetical protein
MLESDYDKTIKYTDTNSLHGVYNIPYNSLSSQITVFPNLIMISILLDDPT